ncbi:MAG: hypothetical protein GF328_06050 [Candidatus Latescibacteria bacterium]|nr:hypothetical protein [Candidatus Latescibacterota bacterium]
MLNAAEICDRHRTAVAAGFLALGLGFTTGALGHLIEGSQVLQWLERGLAGLAVLLIVGAMVWKSVKSVGRGASYIGGTGFVGEAVTKAHVASWASTFILISVFKVFVADRADLPHEFYFDVILAVMLLVHGFVFFTLTRSVQTEQDDHA